jgi:hypothetical protein
MTAYSRGARYTRAWRERKQAGRIILRLEVDETDLAIALIDARLLDPNKADDRAALTAAAHKALRIFCEPSRPDTAIVDTMRVNLALTAMQKVLLDGRSKKRRK